MNKSLTNLKIRSTFGFAMSAIFCIGVMGFVSPRAFAADETCASCGQQVSLSGDFRHRKIDDDVKIEGAANASLFREEVNGVNFNLTIAHLPAGKYTVVIGEVETMATEKGQRTFDVTAGPVTLATNFDIVATAGGTGKVCYIKGVVDHEDDSINGPLTISFAARNGSAKFNTLEVKSAADASLVAFNASELAEPFSAAATRDSGNQRAGIWRDPSQPLLARENDLVRRMSLAEKVAQLQNGAPANSAARLAGV